MFKVGIYARLSKEDGDNIQSESIENQIALINKYMEGNNDFALIDAYIDDGFSGLRYDNRPGFQQMMLDIAAKKIDTIITKDMSRFGRESIETSMYIEKVFPEKGVRYISLLDCYDSYTGSNTELAPFKILFNDMYSRDISKKVRGSFDSKRKNGQFIGSTTPYGYRKSEHERNKLVIDEYAASVVKQIFALYMEGYGKGAIATTLEKNLILPPSVYKKEVLKENYYNPNIRNEKTSWSFQTIHQILVNEVYIGNMIQKKQETISYKVKKKRTIPKKDQIVVKGTHEAIIDKEIFDTVQELMKYRTRSLTINNVDINLFAGKLLCAECGHTFTKIYDSRKKEFIGYVCSQYKRHGNLYCTSHMLKRDEIESLVLDLIKEEARKILKASEIEELFSLPIENINIGVKNLEMQIQILQDKIKETKQYKKKAFENYSDGLLSKEDYIDFNSTYDMKIENNKKKVKELQYGINDKKESEKEYLYWVDKFKNYIDVDKLTRQMVVELIDKIVIDNDKNIDVYFKFQENTST